MSCRRPPAVRANDAWDWRDSVTAYHFVWQMFSI